MEQVLSLVQTKINSNSPNFQAGKKMKMINSTQSYSPRGGKSKLGVIKHSLETYNSREESNNSEG